jgi:hypothetical protein
VDNKKQDMPLARGTVKLSIPNLEKASKLVATIATAREISQVCQLLPCTAKRIRQVTR